MARWVDGGLGSTDANDAELLRHLNTLDFIGERLEEIEAQRRRPAVPPAVPAQRRLDWRGYVLALLRRTA